MTDSAGGIVAVGAFGQGSAVFPKLATFGDVVLSAAGNGDAVVWKLNQHGTTLWAERGGGGLSTDETWGNDIMEGVDSDGAVGPDEY